MSTRTAVGTFVTCRPTLTISVPRGNLEVASEATEPFLRHYGRFYRREAPQFYPDVKGAETEHPELRIRYLAGLLTLAATCETASGANWLFMPNKRWCRYGRACCRCRMEIVLEIKRRVRNAKLWTSAALRSNCLQVDWTKFDHESVPKLAPSASPTL
jgi:hypothetical protein